MNSYGIKRMLGFICFFVVLLPNLALSQEQNQPSEETALPIMVSADNPVTVTGLITVGGGSALEGAKVWIDTNSPIVTDAQGQYSAKAYTGIFNVTVRSVNDEFIGEKQVMVEKGQKEINLNFQFNSTKILGEITENGVVVEGAKVFVGKNGIIITNQSGRYESKVQEGGLRVFATTPAGEFIGEELLTLNKSEEKTVNFDFKPAVIEVTVTEDGKPLTSAKVLIGRNAPVLTDKFGRCVQKVCPGNVTIYVRDSNGRIIGERSVTATLGQTATVDIGK